MSNGDLVKTGFWDDLKPNSSTLHYPHGFGPDLRGIFTQSNYGIITKMVVRLQPKLNGFLFAISFNEDQLNNVTDFIRLNIESKLIDEGILITNQNDPRTTKIGEYDYTGKWLAVGGFSGQNTLIFGIFH